jgi:membrane protease YdiL (CAAX protease family)
MSENINNETVKASQAPLSQSSHSASLGWLDAVVVIIAFVVSMGLGGILCLALGVRMPGEAMTTSFDVEVLEAAASMQARFVAIAYLISMVICYAFLLIYFRLRKMPLKECVYTRFSVSPIRLLTGYVLMWFVSIAVEPLSSLLPGDQDALGGGGWLLISAVLLAPLFEESIFRGYLGGVLRKSYGGLAAWIISAVVFGVVHAIPSVILTATLSGLVLGYYYFRTRSLWMVIALHALNNLTACFLRMIDMGDVPVREMLGGGALYWGVYAFCTLAAVAALVSTGRYVKGIKSDNNSLK